jgi:hypothetical protein
MEMLQGTVAGIRHSTEVSGSENTTSTSHVAVFSVAGRPVELKLSESIVIDNGDEVLLAGNVKRGLFKAMAYRNRTKGVDGKGPALVYWIVGVAFCAFIVFAPIGIFLIRTARRYEAAFRAVTQG